jgi:hypothetical protein
LSIEAGLHAPVIPLEEVPGKVGAVAFLHIDNVVPKLKVGVTFALTVTVRPVETAHCPAEGVKV